MKFDLILADPPWTYNDPKGTKALGGAVASYSVMSDKDLQSLPVQDITSKDSILALWATMPKLQEALDLMKAWNYIYKTCAFVWVKTNPSWKDFPVNKNDIYSGLGHYCAGNSELVLLGKRGKGLERQTKSIKQIVIAPRGNHSSKPEEVRQRLELLFGNVNRLELFGRKKVDGWIVIGNEVQNGKDIRDALKEL